MVSPLAMARCIRATALSISFISMGDSVSFRSRSKNSAAVSGEAMPRTASTTAIR